MTYNLTDEGKAIKWSDWRKWGGCGISNHQYGYVANKLGPSSLWIKIGVTLGDIASASKIAERELSRYAAENFPDKNMTFVEYP